MRKEKSVLLSALAILVLPFLVTQKAHATTTVTNTVNSSSNGENASSNVSITNDASSNSNTNTVTTQGGHSRVEINGKVYESDGDLDVVEGGNSVHIKKGSEVKVDAKSVTEISSKSAKEKEKIKAKKKELRDKIKNQKADFNDILKERLEFLRKIISLQFLFGDK